MIYWFTGQPGAGKTIQATKLKEFLQTEKRNWRKDVFHIDGDDSNVVRVLLKYMCTLIVKGIEKNLKYRGMKHLN